MERRGDIRRVGMSNNGHVPTHYSSSLTIRLALLSVDFEHWRKRKKKKKTGSG